jgi:RecA-family ATPase
MAVLPFPFDPRKVELDELAQIDQIRTDLVHNGWQPIPVQTGQKRPDGFRWQATKGLLPPAGPRSKNTGILATGLRAIDVDIDDPTAASTVEMTILNIAGETPLVRVRDGSVRVLMVYRAPDGTTPDKATKILPVGRVEILGRGQQFVAYGQHPDGDEYQWRGPAPDTIPRSEVPVLTEAAEAALLNALQSVFSAPIQAQAEEPRRMHREPIRTAVEGERRYAEAALDAEVKLVAQAPPGARNNELNKAALKLGHQVAAGRLSTGEVRDALFRAAEASGLVKDDGANATLKTIESGLRAGLQQPAPPLQTTEPDPVAAEITRRLVAKREVADSETGELTTEEVPLLTGGRKILPILDPRIFDGSPVPQRQWIVEDFIPAGTVTSLSGDGGTGKSLLALQLAVATAVGVPWLGRNVPMGRSLFLTAEDEIDEVHRRLWDICYAEGIKFNLLEDLRIAPLAGIDALLASPDRTGTMRPTALMKELDGFLKEWPPSLVVLDTQADLFGGNEVDRVQVRSFVTMLRNLCLERGCTIVLLSHPSVAGMNTGSGLSGSTAWNNSVRSRLYLRRDISGDGQDLVEADPDLRVLTNKKANYGQAGGELRMRWDAGRFSPLDQDAGPIDLAGTRARVDELFMELLAKHTNPLRMGRLNAHSGPNYAPRVFAEDPDARGTTQKAFKAAMGRLFDAGRIRNVETIVSRRRTTYIVATTPYDVPAEG